MALSYRTNNVMILLGDDVFYDNITLARNQILFMRDLQSKKENIIILEDGDDLVSII